MKLLFVNSAWPESWGGGEKWTVDAAEWFRSQGHDVVVVGRADSRLVQAARRKNLEVIETIFGGDWDPAAIHRANRILRRVGPDLVVVNFNKEAWQFGLAARMRNTPVVARHGFPLFKRRFHHRILAHHVLSRLVVNAASIREEYARLGVRVKNIPVIHNGVRTIEQHPGSLRQRFQIEKDAPLIVAAGRLESQKRFDRLIEITARLVSAHPALRVVIAGEGPLRGDLEKTVRERSLQDHMHFVGFMPDFAETACDADAFALTSDEEGTPNVLLEAMAAGAACVAFRVGAVSEVLGPELAEFAIPAGNIEQMTTCIGALLRDESRRKATAESMKIRVQQHFSLEESMRQFEKLFREVTVHT